MRTREALLGVLLVFLVAVPLTLVYPPVDDMWVQNPYWNGLSEFYRELDPLRIRGAGDMAGTDPLNSTLFIVGPSREFTTDDVETVKAYLQDGGRVVIMDDFGSANMLLEGLGVEDRFMDAVLRDGVFFDLKPEFPRVVNSSLHGVESIVFNYGSVLSLKDESKALALSTPFSYITVNEQVITGEHPVLAQVNYGGGQVYLVSDASVFLNSMIHRGDNRGLLEALSRGLPMINVAHSHPTLLLGFKWWIVDLYHFLGLLEIRYGLALILVLTVYRIKPGTKDRREDEVDKVLNRHPGWDKEKLEWLYRQRKKHEQGEE